MAKYRPVYTKIWNDRDFMKLSKDGKFLFMYFITNNHINNSGIFELPLKTISMETGIPIPTIDHILTNGSIKNVFYDSENEIIFVKNIRKYNRAGAPAQVEKGIISENLETGKTFLWNLFLELNPQFKGKLSIIDQSLPNDSIPIPLPLPLCLDSNVLTNNKPLKMENWFDEDWKDYPKGGDKQRAKSHYLKTVKSKSLREEFRFKTGEYLKSVDDSKYIKNGDTWFCNWDKYETKQPMVRKPKSKIADRISNIIKAGGDENGNRQADPGGVDIIDIGGVSQGDGGGAYLEGVENNI